MKACQVVLYYSNVYLMVYIWIPINSAARRRRFLQHRLYLHQWTGRDTLNTRTCRYMTVSTINTQRRMVSTSVANYWVSSSLTRLICLTLLTNAYNITLAAETCPNYVCVPFRYGRLTLSTAVARHYCWPLSAVFSATEDGKADGRRTNNKIPIIQSNSVCILHYIIKNHTHV